MDEAKILGVGGFGSGSVASMFTNLDWWQVGLIGFAIINLAYFIIIGQSRGWFSYRKALIVIKLETALIEIGGQHLSTEGECPGDGDYEYGYDAIIKIARAALEDKP